MMGVMTQAAQWSEQDWKRLGTRVRKHRERLRWSQTTLAARAHMSRRTVSSVEAGTRRTYQDENLRAISRALGWGEDGLHSILNGLQPQRPGLSADDRIGDWVVWVGTLSKSEAAREVASVLGRFTGNSQHSGHDAESA